MNHTKESLTNLFTALKSLENQSKNYITSVPIDLREAVFDNGYVHGLGRQFDAALRYIIQDDVALDGVYEFLVTEDDRLPISYTVTENNVAAEYEISDADSLADFVLAIIGDK